MKTQKQNKTNKKKYLKTPVHKSNLIKRNEKVKVKVIEKKESCVQI